MATGSGGVGGSGRNSGSHAARPSNPSINPYDSLNRDHARGRAQTRVEGEAKRAFEQTTDPVTKRGEVAVPAQAATKRSWLEEAAAYRKQELTRKFGTYRAWTAPAAPALAPGMNTALVRTRGFDQALQASGIAVERRMPEAAPESHAPLAPALARVAENTAAAAAATQGTAAEISARAAGSALAQPKDVAAKAEVTPAKTAEKGIEIGD